MDRTYPYQDSEGTTRWACCDSEIGPTCEHRKLPMQWFVYRDGEKVSDALESESACFTWLLKHQAMSVDWALKHEGYSFAVDAQSAE